MKKQEFKEEFSKRVENALGAIKYEEIRANDGQSIAYKMQSLIDVTWGYIKKPTNKDEFVKEVETLIYCITSTFSNQTFKAGNIIKFNSNLIGINNAVKNYVNRK